MAAKPYDASKQETATRNAGGSEKYNDPVYDTFNAHEVVAPSTGEWGSPNTTAAGYETQQRKLGTEARDRYAEQAQNARVSSRVQAGNAGNRADMYNRRQGPTTDFSQANQAGAGTERTLAALDTFAANQNGPSGAQAQLRQATQEGLGAQLAMARSGRGFGSNAANQGLAQSAMAGVSANAANQSAQLRAQEDAAAKQRQLAALGQSLGGGLGLGQQYGQQAQFDTTSALAARGQNDAASLAQHQLGLAYNQLGNQTALGYSGLGEQTNLGFQQMGQNALNQQADYELAQQKMNLEAQMANQQADTDRDAANLGMVGSLFGAMFSDRRGKEEIARLEGANEALTSALGKRGPALETLAGAPAYSYRYKDPSAPGAKPGRMVGPMAQDLERGPLGDSLVMDTPQGKMIDTPRMTMATAAAVSEQQRQLDALRRSLGKAA